MPRGRKLIKTIEIEECTLENATIEFFRNNTTKGLSKATQRAYTNYINCFVNWIGKEKSVSSITSKLLDNYIYYLTEKGIKPVSTATNMRHVRRFVNFCISRGYIEELHVTIPKYEEELKEPYSDEEMKLLLIRPTSNNWVEYRNWVMVNYFFSTGHRLSTVLNIKVEHLDFEHKKVKLIWNKDKRPKYMPLSSGIIKVLKEYIDRSALEDNEYLFPEYEGGQLKVRSAEDAIAKYNRSRGVEKTSIHLFRHSFARSYIINGGNPMMLQKLLNHKTMDMTLKYVNLYGNDIAKDIDVFNPLDNFRKNNYMPTKRTKIMNNGDAYER